jgi:hypothetical protein
MEPIRLRYSGVIVFLARFFALLTGTIFTVVIANKLTEADFGIWQIIQTSQGYTFFLIPVMAYWAVRYLSRDTDVGRTSLLGALIVSIPGVVIYSIAASYYIGILEIPIFYFLLGLLQIPLFFMIGSLQSISQGTKPQRMSYAFVVSEISKIVLAVPLLIWLDQGLDVVIMIVLTTQVIQMIFLAFYNRQHLKDRFNYEIIKKWLKISWIPILISISGLIYSLDMVIVTYVTKSAETVAYFKAAFVLANMITFAQLLGIALYPKIMKGGNSDDVESTLKLLLMFLIPLATGLFFLSEHFLFLLKDSYLESFNALQILIASSVIVVFYLFFDNILAGTVKTETEDNLTFKKLLKSRLFLISKIGIAWSVTYLILLYLLLFFISPKIDDYGLISTIWAIATLIAIIPYATYKGMLARRILYFKIPWKLLGKYVISSALMVFVLLIIRPLLDYNLPKFTFGLFIGGEIIIAIATYFIILYGIDKEFRLMVNSAKEMI